MFGAPEGANMRRVLDVRHLPHSLLVAGASTARRGLQSLPGWESPAPTEERIVALVREGLTNPHSAERLFVARRTVKVHLGHIFAKLGLATRAELAAHATRRAIARG